VKANCTGGEGFIDDVAESFGDLDCIFCLLSRDEMKSMSNIVGGKLGWATTSGLLDLRTLFGMKSGDGGNIKTSGRGNGVSRVASIKHGEDTVLLSNKKGSHDGGGWK
jgi:hypothetical protein